MKAADWPRLLRPKCLGTCWAASTNHRSASCGAGPRYRDPTNGSSKPNFPSSLFWPPSQTNVQHHHHSGFPMGHQSPQTVHKLVPGRWRHLLIHIATNLFNGIQTVRRCWKPGETLAVVCMMCSASPPTEKRCGAVLRFRSCAAQRG